MCKFGTPMGIGFKESATFAFIHGRWAFFNAPPGHAPGSGTLRPRQRKTARRELRLIGNTAVKALSVETTDNHNSKGWF